VTDVAELEVVAKSRGVTQTTKDLNGLANSGERAEKATNKFADQMGKFIGRVAIVGTATAAFVKFVDVTRRFQQLQAQLETATGSAQRAAVAFDALKDFAATTPYSVEQATDAFIKLTNLGLSPSEKALRAYGNTASAMGKELNQLIEAVADASTGEFERLKEFGIKARQEGDNVTFTFRGVATTVRKEAGEIEEYLQRIGEVEFAGAMARQADTLNGALSNLGDATDQLFMSISELGAGEIFEDIIRGATSGIQELTDMIASGQIEGYLGAILGKFDGWAKDISNGAEIVGEIFSQTWEIIGTEGEGLFSFLTDAATNWVENTRSLLQILAVETASVFDKAGAVIDEVFIQNNKDADAVLEGIANRWETSNSARFESIDLIVQERDAALQSFRDQIQAADQARQSYDQLRDARRQAAEGSDRLAEFRTGAPRGRTEGSSEKKQREKEFESLIEQLATEEEAIRASYERRQAIILENTDAGSARQLDLMVRNEEKMNEEIETLRSKDIDNLRESLMNETEQIENEYQERLEIIRSNEQLLADEKIALLDKVELDRLTKLREYREQENRMVRAFGHEQVNEYKSYLDAIEEVQGASWDAQALTYTGMLVQMTASGARESRKQFELNKAAGISNALVSAGVGAAKALEWGWPMGPIFAGLIWLNALSQVNRIRGTSYGGGGAGGGSVSSSAGAMGGAAASVPTSGLTMAPQQQAVAQQGPTINIYGGIQGNDAKKIFNEFKELIGKADFVLIEENTTNGMRLRGTGT